MSIQFFDTEVLSSFGLPSSYQNVLFSLSGGRAPYRTVHLQRLGTVNGRAPIGLAFNSLAAPGSGVGIFAQLSVFSGLSARVDRAHHGSEFAILFDDYTSSIFTVNTASNPQTITPNGYKATHPEIARLRHLGYI